MLACRASGCSWLSPPSGPDEHVDDARASSKAGPRPPTPRRCRRASTRPRPAPRSSSRPGTIAGDLVIDRPLTLRGHGTAAPPGLRQGQRRSRPRRGRDDRGLRHRRPRRAATSAATPRASTSPRRGPPIRDCRIVNALFGVYLREAHGAVVEGCRDPRHPRQGPGREGLGHPRLEHRRASASRATRSWTCATASTSSPRRTGRSARNVARDLRYGLHYMFSDDNVFEDNLFENGAAGAALMYSKRIVVPPQPLPPQPRLRLGGPALQGLRRRGRRGQPDRRQRPRDLPRGLLPQRLPAATSWPLSDAAIVLYDSSRPEPLRGQLLRRQPDARSTSWAGAPTPSSTATTGPRTTSPTSTATAAATGPTGSPSVFDHFRGNLTAADLMSQGIAARGAGASAERDLPGAPSRSRSRTTRPSSRPPALPERPARRPRASAAGERGAAWRSPALGLGAWRSAATVLLRGPAVISFRAFSKRFGALTRRRRPRPRDRRGRGRGAPRPQRLGQDHVAQGRRRPRRPDLGRGAPRRPDRRPIRARARGPLVPAPARLLSRGAVGARGAGVLPRPCGAWRPRAVDAVLKFAALNGSGSPRRGPVLRAAWCSAWASRWRCCPTRRCCSSTSPRPPSTPTASAPSTASSAAGAARARRCSSPRTTWATWSGWPTASRSWWRAGWWRRSPRASSRTGSPSAG